MTCRTGISRLAAAIRSKVSSSILGAIAWCVCLALSPVPGNSRCTQPGRDLVQCHFERAERLPEGLICIRALGRSESPGSPFDYLAVLDLVHLGRSPLPSSSQIRTTGGETTESP